AISLHLVADQKAIVGMTGLILALVGANRLNHREWIAFVLVSLMLLALASGLDYIKGLPVDTTAYGALMVMLLVAPLIYRREMTQIEISLMERNASLNRTVRRIEALATTDTLTGLANRRRLQEVLTYNKAMADRQSGYSFALCYMDLDFFKQVNDRFGHSAGDRVLQEVARLAQLVVRSVDCVARVGGEEFILVLTHSTEEDAQHVAERLVLGLQDIEVSPMDSNYRVTASLGITRYLSPESVEDTVERADKSLYDAKRSGRNRIVQADVTQQRQNAPLQEVGSTGRSDRET
ncbi:MAG: GGDEF domain-containing protein, partial [Pseudomonadota bacterium]